MRKVCYLFDHLLKVRRVRVGIVLLESEIDCFRAIGVPEEQEGQGGTFEEIVLRKPTVLVHGVANDCKYLEWVVDVEVVVILEVSVREHDKLEVLDEVGLINLLS